MAPPPTGSSGTSSGRVRYDLAASQPRQTTDNDGLPYGETGATAGTAAYSRHRASLASSQEWEALIGGNIFNKVGALLLVIGIMSFMSYYGTRMGPAGRAAGCALASLALLGIGRMGGAPRKISDVCGRPDRWGMGGAVCDVIRHLCSASRAHHRQPFHRIAAGAAGRRGDDCALASLSCPGHHGGCILLRVCGAGHHPSTLFAVLALIPLAGAVLYLAQRFDWYLMALMGVFATYGACAARFVGRAADGIGDAVHRLLGAVRSLRHHAFLTPRERLGSGVDLPAKRRRFFGAVVCVVDQQVAGDFWEFSVCAALLYLVSTLWRVKIENDRGFDHSADLPDAYPFGQLMKRRWLSARFSLRPLSCRS